MFNLVRSPSSPLAGADASSGIKAPSPAQLRFLFNEYARLGLRTGDQTI